jgi:hypothetical protein
MMLTVGDIIKVSTSREFGFFKIVGFSEIGIAETMYMSYTSGTAQKYWGNLKITLRTFSSIWLKMATLRVSQSI